MARATRKQPAADVLKPEDRALLESPLGRENDFGASDRNDLTEDDIRRPEVNSHPRSEVTGRHDAGSGANETVDGLTDLEEAARHGAEDVPSSERGERFDDLPVFDRGESEPKI